MPFLPPNQQHQNTRAAVGMGIPMGMDMGMIFHPHRPMGILWGFLIYLK